MRTKGHNFERLISKAFKSLGFNSRTTRQASTLLDSCGVDIVGTPFIIQCKAGYAKSRPKFEEEYIYIKNRLTEEFGPNHRVHNYPIIIMHQLDAPKGRGHHRTDEQTYVMMTMNDFMNMVAINPPSSYETLDVL